MISVFEYEVAPAARERFEEVYGPDGEWAAFFRQGDGYLGTELLRRDDDAARYLVIDRWSSAEAYSGFLAAHRTEYERRSEAGSALFRRESVIGRFLPAGRAGREPPASPGTTAR